MMPDTSADATYLTFDRVRKSYDQEHLVVQDFSLAVAKGEFLTLLGPSGSGKSTVLMMLAGFESVTSGDITIAGVSITRLPPYRRNIGMVFQNYALFPHMTIAENLAYPLTVRKWAKAAIRARVDEYLQLIALQDFGKRYPGQLSGGQRQRVALARALIFEPALVLMDEPLGALDKKLREQMQYEIKRLHDLRGYTILYVTHDQTEALSMSDRIAVFNDGVVQQCDRPDQLYERPRNAFVADFLGENNFLPGTVLQGDGETVQVRLTHGETVQASCHEPLPAGLPVRVSVRPEKLFIEPHGPPCENRVAARFVTRQYVGDFIRYYFSLADGTEILVKILNDRAAPQFLEGERAGLMWLGKDGAAYPLS